MFEYYNDLALAIVQQAVEDYKLLQFLGVEKYYFFEDQKTTKTEIEEFFRSPWCDLLLSSVQLTGLDILKRLGVEV